MLHDPQQQGSCSQGDDRDESSAALGEGQATSRYPAGMIERVRKLPNGESLIDLLNRNAVRLDDTKFLVLDEADQMLDLGFIHSLSKIADLLPENRQTMLFSATFQTVT